MKRTLWNITLASLITLVAYIALYAIWGALLSEVENSTVRLFLIALMTTLAFGFFLLWTAKIRRSVGEEEVRSDYREPRDYTLSGELSLILKREKETLIAIIAIVLIRFALNTFDSLVFGKKMISHPTFFYVPLCLFSSSIPLPFVGDAVSALLDCVAYLGFLLLYRRKKYRYWIKNKESSAYGTEK